MFLTISFIISRRVQQALIYLHNFLCIFFRSINCVAVIFHMGASEEQAYKLRKANRPLKMGRVYGH